MQDKTKQNLKGESKTNKRSSSHKKQATKKYGKANKQTNN